jgi:hypothetical protein
LGEKLVPKNNQSKKQAKKAGPLIICECGFEILLIPDLKMMTRAIEAHAAKHGKKVEDPAKAAFEEERIQVFLSAQALNGAAAS